MRAGAPAPDVMWVTGRHPVEELLASSIQRPRSILIAAGAPEDIRKSVAARADAAGIPFVTVPNEEFARRTGERGGGIAAEIGDFRYAVFEEWLDGLPERAAAFLLDGITDPQNLGAILRSARAFGIAGVVAPKDRSCPVTAAVFRASAGGAAHVPVVRVANLARAIGAMKERRFWVFAAEAEGETALPDFRPPDRTAVVLGSEGGGIRRLVREKCDGGLRIPMEPFADSLNVSVAAGIVAYSLRNALTACRK
ncbi:MAG: 23S rRNA (guanosine(2251)-2'-O)-methyltransferase RlmB [Deltaproteobacteria bacterium]|nr:23S rRNA (guanosine(2251)-2'-O)-methyltransferase RlmB [Deltaproteobacteria bacterium]